MDIKYTVSKNGTVKAFQFSTRQIRWFPISVARADELILSGQASIYIEEKSVQQ